MLSVSFLADTALAEPLREIVSAAYDEGEAGLWRPGHARISVAAVAALIERGELAAACEDGRPPGCVRVSRADARTGEFGLLAAARDATNRGVGRALVAFAEDTARARGATAIRLELLVPRDGTHPAKQRLDAWYTRLGYRVTGRTGFAAAYPEMPRGWLCRATW